MSSSNKTELGLNLWLGGDKPKREDFCNDNLIIDKQITEHKNDVSYHVSQEDRENGTRMCIAVFITALANQFAVFKPDAHLNRL